MPQSRRLHPDAGVLLIGHGTREAVGRDQMLRLADRLAEQLAPHPVEPCFLELSQPDIATGWARLLARGAKQVHAAPLLLFAAGHAKADIPAALAACGRTAPAVRWDQARPLSRAAEMIQLVTRRWRDGLHRQRFAPQRTAIVVVGRGSRFPCAQADLKVLAACAARRLPVARVEVAYYAMAEPRLPAVLDRLATDRHIENLLIQPHLLFDGAILAATKDQVAAAAQRLTRFRLAVTDPLGPDPLVAQAIVRRVSQSLQVGNPGSVLAASPPG